MEEAWKEVEGYEGFYAVSTLGRVKSLPRITWFDNGKGRCFRNSGGMILSPSIEGKGYLAVVLTKERKRKTWMVHTLVARAFLGPKPFAGAIVCHGAGGRRDNSISNICYGTYSKNNGVDRLRDGTACVGINHPRFVLTDELVAEVIRLRQAGTAVKAVAERLEVSVSSVMRASRLGKFAQL
jgi:hypothetical protein